MGKNETSTAQGRRRPGPLALTRLFGYFPPAVAKVYIVSFRTYNDGAIAQFMSRLMDAAVSPQRSPVLLFTGIASL
jgi:hypothetical protein